MPGEIKLSPKSPAGRRGYLYKVQYRGLMGPFGACFCGVRGCAIMPACKVSALHRQERLSPRPPASGAICVLSHSGRKK